MPTKQFGCSPREAAFYHVIWLYNWQGIGVVISCCYTHADKSTQDI